MYKYSKQYKNNTKLYNRIADGLDIAIKDGSFEKVFSTHPITKEVMKAAAIHGRKVFIFTNPILSEKSLSLLREPKYWISLSR